MATPTYTIKVLKADKASIELEVKAALDEVVYAWPSLAVRALADASSSGSGSISPLASFDCATRDGLRDAVDAWIERVEIIATRKSLAQYRVFAKKPGLTDKLKKGVTWTSSAIHADAHVYGTAALAAGGKLVAVVVKPGSVVPFGAVELLSVTKKGPGATKGWLNHVGVAGVAALDSRIITWSADNARIWSESAELLQEHSGAVNCACLTSAGYALGTPSGVDINGELFAIGAVRALAYSQAHLYALTEAGDVVVFSGKTEARRIQAVTGDRLAVAAFGDQLAIVGDDERVRWYRDGALLGTVEMATFEGRTVHHATEISNGCVVGGYKEIYAVDDEGQARVFDPPLTAYYLSAEAGLILAANLHNEQSRARLWREDGTFLGEIVLPRPSLHRAEMPPRPPPIRLTRDGAWILCAEFENENGGVRLVGTRGQGQIRFPNPNTNYDFLTDVEQMSEDTFLIGYGNHDAMLWNLDGTHKNIGIRFDCIWHGHGRTLTSYYKEITERDADLNPIRSFTVDLPYSLHWLSVSGQGRYVVAGAQPRSWIHDLETGEQWELEQPGGVNMPTFAGNPRYLITTNLTRGEQEYQTRIWDVVERKVVVHLPEIHHVYGVHWITEDTVLIVGISGIWKVNVRGDKQCVLPIPPSGQRLDRMASIGFDAAGRLFTHGERGHLYMWSNPRENRSHGGYQGPSVLEFQPGWCICFDAWPAIAMRMPGR